MRLVLMVSDKRDPYFLFSEKRGVLDFDNANDEYVEAYIKTVYAHLSRLKDNYSELTLYDTLKELGIKPLRYLVFFGWRKEDEIGMEWLIDEDGIRLQFIDCKML